MNDQVTIKNTGSNIYDKNTSAISEFRGSSGLARQNSLQKIKDEKLPTIADLITTEKFLSEILDTPLPNKNEGHDQFTWKYLFDGHLSANNENTPQNLKLKDLILSTDKVLKNGEKTSDGAILVSRINSIKEFLSYENPKHQSIQEVYSMLKELLPNETKQSILVKVYKLFMHENADPFIDSLKEKDNKEKFKGYISTWGKDLSSSSNILSSYLNSFNSQEISDIYSSNLAFKIHQQLNAVYGNLKSSEFFVKRVGRVITLSKGFLDDGESFETVESNQPRVKEITSNLENNLKVLKDIFTTTAIQPSDSDDLREMLIYVKENPDLIKMLADPKMQSVFELMRKNNKFESNKIDTFGTDGLIFKSGNGLLKSFHEEFADFSKLESPDKTIKSFYDLSPDFFNFLPSNKIIEIVSHFSKNITPGEEFSNLAKSGFGNFLTRITKEHPNIINEIDKERFTNLITFFNSNGIAILDNFKNQPLDESIALLPNETTQLISQLKQPFPKIKFERLSDLSKQFSEGFQNTTNIDPTSQKKDDLNTQKDNLKEFLNHIDKILNSDESKKLYEYVEMLGPKATIDLSEFETIVSSKIAYDKAKKEGESVEEEFQILNIDKTEVRRTLEKVAGFAKEIDPEKELSAGDIFFEFEKYNEILAKPLDSLYEKHLKTYFKLAGKDQEISQTLNDFILSDNTKDMVSFDNTFNQLGVLKIKDEVIYELLLTSEVSVTDINQNLNQIRSFLVGFKYVADNNEVLNGIINILKPKKQD